MAKVAKWIEYKIPHIIVCSNCDYGTGVKEKKKLKKCPNCGTKMLIHKKSGWTEVK